MKNFLLVIFLTLGLSSAYADPLDSIVLDVMTDYPPSDLKPGAMKEPVVFGVHVDCFLQTPVDCRKLRDRFFQNVSNVKRAELSKAHVVLRVRAINAPNAYQYQIHVSGQNGLNGVFEIPKEFLLIRDSVSSTAQELELVNHMAAGIGPYLDIVKASTDNRGRLTITFDNKRVPEGSKKADSKWSYTAHVSGSYNFAQNQNKRLSGFGFLQARHTGKTWFHNVGGWISYSKDSFEIDDETVSVERKRGGIWARGARAINENWSVMAIVRSDTDKSSNLDNRSQLHTGIEYTLKPFLETNDSTFSVSYIIGGRYENYVAENINLKEKELYPTHAASVYFIKHYEKLDLSATAGVASLVKEPRKVAVGGSGSVSYFLTKNIKFSVNSDIGWKRNIIHAPNDPEALDPFLAVVGAGSSVSPLTITTMLNLSFSWGNTALSNQDQRWRYTALELPLNF